MRQSRWRVAPLTYFLCATMLITAGCLIGLRGAHRRLKPRRIVLVILLAVVVSWFIWTLVSRMSEPAPPGEGPVEVN